VPTKGSVTNACRQVADKFISNMPAGIFATICNYLSESYHQSIYQKSIKSLVFIYQPVDAL
jgi:hypothetical protein